jgi:hypothetical protein
MPSRHSLRASVCRAQIILGLVAVAMALAATPATAGLKPDSATRLIVWHECDELVELTDAELDVWRQRGVGGFACNFGWLRGMGGAHAFSADPDAQLSGPSYALQRRFRDSDVVGRLRKRGMKAYLGFYLANYWNRATPLMDWFDDGAWSRTVVPAVHDAAGAAHKLGFAGLAVDQELYGQEGGVQTATWNWRYPGNKRSEQTVRQEARRRGREVMRALVDGFPDLEMLAYDVHFPESWGEVVQEQTNGIRAGYRDRLDVDFWNGLTSVEGYGALRLLDAAFYKQPHYGSWDTALEYNSNRTFAYLSRKLSNWSYASSRMFVSPFAWIDGGNCGCAWEQPRPPGYVADQLQAFSRWAMGGEFAAYSYAGVRNFDYSPYDGALRASTRPAVVDGRAPELTVGEPAVQRRSLRLTGTAGDNLAVRAVRWSAGDRHGTARMTWAASGNPREGYRGAMRWRTRSIPLERGRTRVVVAAEDIKGHVTRRTFTVRVR